MQAGAKPKLYCWRRLQIDPGANLRRREHECAFSKMARTFLRHIRVASKDDLKQRILKGIAEINASPVVFRWNKFDLGIA